MKKGKTTKPLWHFQMDFAFLLFPDTSRVQRDFVVFPVSRQTSDWKYHLPLYSRICFPCFQTLSDLYGKGRVTECGKCLKTEKNIKILCWSKKFCTEWPFRCLDVSNYFLRKYCFWTLIHLSIDVTCWRHRGLLQMKYNMSKLIGFLVVGY